MLIDKKYTLETEFGSASVADLFDGRSQLLVYHLIFGPDYAAGCSSCSAIADEFDGDVLSHTTPDGPSQGAGQTRTDVATYARERPGMSSFVMENGNIFHTYSAYSRSLDAIWSVYRWLDRAPKGRNESEYWRRRHDEYVD